MKRGLPCNGHIVFYNWLSCRQGGGELPLFRTDFRGFRRESEFWGGERFSAISVREQSQTVCNDRVTQQNGAMILSFGIL
jgi:hypothetical protein